LPEAVKEKETAIPWLLIKGMRNRLIHEYFGTDLPLSGIPLRMICPYLRQNWKEFKQGY